MNHNHSYHTMVGRLHTICGYFVPLKKSDSGGQIDLFQYNSDDNFETEHPNGNFETSYPLVITWLSDWTHSKSANHSNVSL